MICLCFSCVQGVLTVRAPVVFWFPGRLSFVKICCGALKPFQRIFLSSSKLFCDSVACCAETESDPISETTPVVLSVPDTAVDATDSAGANMVARDSLQMLLQHGNRQSVEMEATSSAVACAEAGPLSLLLSLTDICWRRYAS